MPRRIFLHHYLMNVRILLLISQPQVQRSERRGTC